MSTSRTTRLFAAVVAALTLAACGNSGGDQPDTTLPETSSTTGAENPTTTQADEAQPTTTQAESAPPATDEELSAMVIRVCESIDTASFEDYLGGPVEVVADDVQISVGQAGCEVRNEAFEIVYVIVRYESGAWDRFLLTNDSSVFVAVDGIGEEAYVYPTTTASGTEVTEFHARFATGAQLKLYRSTTTDMGDPTNEQWAAMGAAALAAAEPGCDVFDCS